MEDGGGGGGGRCSSSALFSGFRALGLFSSHIPHVVRYHGRHRKFYVTTCVGKSFHTYNVSSPSLFPPAASPASPWSLASLAPTRVRACAAGFLILAPSPTPVSCWASKDPPESCLSKAPGLRVKQALWMDSFIPHSLVSAVFYGIAQSPWFATLLSSFDPSKNQLPMLVCTLSFLGSRDIALSWISSCLSDCTCLSLAESSPS